MAFILSNGDSSSGITIEDDYMTILDGCTASDTTIDSEGELFVESGGTANSTTVNAGGYCYVSEGGYAQSTTINNGGEINVWSGGTATQIVAEAGAILSFDVASDTRVQGTSNGVAFEMTDANLTDYTVNSGGSIFVSSGGTANSTTVNISGYLYVSSGGTANNTTVNSLGELYVMDGGIANSTTLNHGGELYVEEDGIANSTTVNPGGFLYISGGGNAVEIIENGGYVEIADGATASFVSNTFTGLILSDKQSATVHHGTTATDTTINIGCNFDVFSSGLADNTTVNERGEFNLYGGVAVNTTIHGENGIFHIYSGKADNTTINSGYLYVHSGGTAVNAAVNPDGHLYVYSGGKITGSIRFEEEAIVSCFHGAILDFDLTRTEAGAAALVNDLSIIDGLPQYTLTVDGTQTNGTYYLAEGAANFKSTISVLNLAGYELGALLPNGEETTINGTNYILTLTDGILALTVNGKSPSGEILVDYNVFTGDLNAESKVISDGILAVDVNINEDARLDINDGGTADNATVNERGELYVYYGGVVNNITVYSGGDLYVQEGGKLTGTMTFEAGAGIFMHEGATINFDLTQAETDGKELLNNLSIIQGTLTFTLTVNGTEENGVYSLANGADNFDSTISVVNTAGGFLGTLAVGETVTINGKDYTLTLNNGNLMLTLNKSGATPPEEPVISVEDKDILLANPMPQAEYMYGCTPTAVGMLLGYYDLFGYQGKGFSNLIEGEVDLYSRGTDGDAYNMNAFDTVLGRAIASEEYVYRFVSRDGAETTSAQELEYAFNPDGTLNTSVWNCIADYLGTGQYWRRNSNLSTSTTICSLEDLYRYNYQDVTIHDGTTSRTISYKETAMLYGVDLYVQSRGYVLDTAGTGTYNADVNGGSFSFADYMAEIDAGRPVIVSIQNHSMVGYGYNAATQEIIFDDCYESGQRMVWDGTYYYAGANRKLQSITVIALDASIADPGPRKPNVSADLSDETGQTVTLTPAFSDDSAVMEYSLDGTTWQEYTGPLTFTENISVYFRSADAAGNYSLITRYDITSIEIETIPDGASIVSGQNNRTLSFTNDVYVKKGASIRAGYPGALQVTGDGHTVTLGGNNELYCSSIRNADILFGHDAYWTDDDIGPHYDGTVNINGENISFYSSVSNCITAAGIVGNNLTVTFNGVASGSKNISFESTNPSSGAGNIAAAIMADEDLTVNGTFGGNINCNFDFSPLADSRRRYGELYGFSAGKDLTVNGSITGDMSMSAISIDGGCAYGLNAGGDLTVNGDISGDISLSIDSASDYSAFACGLSANGNVTVNGGISANVFLSVVSTSKSYAYGLSADGIFAVTGEISGVIAATAGNTVYAIYGGQVDVTVSGTIFAGKTTEENDMSTLLDKFEDWDTYKEELLGLSGQNCYAIYASDEKSRITLRENALIIGNFGLYYASDSVITVSDAACIFGDFFTYYSGNSLVLKLNDASLNGTRIVSSSWNSLISVNVDVDGITSDGTYSLVETASSSSLKSVVLSAAGNENTLAVGKSIQIGKVEYALDKVSSGSGEKLILTVSGLSSSSGETIENLAATPDKVSWDATEAEQYIVEYSTDDFKHVIRMVTTASAADMLELPAGTYQWRVKADSGEEWSVGEAFVSENESVAPKVVQSNGDGNDDLFFAKANSVWESGYAAQHAGSLGGWTGTKEKVTLSGKNRLADIFKGSTDANILLMTDDENGDALFVDDIYTAWPGTVTEQQARIARINEVRAGAGNDVVDMTSQRFEYTGDGLTIRGGDGDDVIWANKGGNFLFGDAGNDRIVGASGDDIIVGGTGNDSMHGGGGNDMFAFCGNWGTDTVEQLADSTVTLWFASGDESNWNAGTLTYTDGENSVTVSGIAADRVALKFGDDGSERFAVLSNAGAFDAFTSQKIFEAADTGILANL